MDDATRWMFHRYIEPLRAREMWELRKCLASVRAKPEDLRDYITTLATLAFWDDELMKATIIEAASREE